MHLRLRGSHVHTRLRPPNSPPPVPPKKHEVETLYNAEWRIRRLRRGEVAHVEYQIERVEHEDKDLAIGGGYQIDIGTGGSGGVESVYQFEPAPSVSPRPPKAPRQRQPAPPINENPQNEPKPLTANH
jgi:hypothetical protein